MTTISTDEKARDDLAEVVMQRFRRAHDYRGSYVVHQRKTAESLLIRGDHQYRREYTAEDQGDMQASFGFCPTRYYGVTQQKVNAGVAWHMDLVVNNLDSMFTVTPSPNPTLDRGSIERIRNGVRRELLERMANAGLADPNLLLTAEGETQERIKDFLAEQAAELRKVEQARIVALAGTRAKVIQDDMRDTMVEGEFRQAYASYTFDRYLHGIGYMKFPDWRRRPVLKHKSKGGASLQWETRPWFRHVPVLDFFPIDDAKDLQSNTGNTERTFVTKAELISMALQDGYDRGQIESILDDYEVMPRNWLPGAMDARDANDRINNWGLDETIPLLIHEGFFSGGELAKYGVTGVDKLDYVSARVEICGWRTIRCELVRLPGGANRSYFGAAYQKIGTNLYDYLGLGSMLWDTEQRVNRFMHLFEHNADWAARPPVMRNRSALSNPNDADIIAPGGQYDVEERFGVTGSMPDTLRTMNVVSAQYHLLMTQVGALLRQADEDCGIPAFAYSSQDFGRSSLGEYSQRMSNALRTIKMSALNEDIYFIEPTFKGMFDYKMEDNPELAEGQDVDCLVRGMTGLLKEDLAAQIQSQAIPMVLNAPPGVVPEPAVNYAVRQLLQNAGFPVDALGMSDPVVDQALAVAARQPLPSVTPGGPQVPQLDGRSGGVPAGAVSSPSGQSNFSIPNPSIG